MNTSTTSINWLHAVRESVTSYKKMIDATVAQLSDEELFRRPAPGNQLGRYPFAASGRQPAEPVDGLFDHGWREARPGSGTRFPTWDGDRASLVAYFHDGWNALTAPRPARRYEHYDNGSDSRRATDGTAGGHPFDHASLVSCGADRHRGSDGACWRVEMADNRSWQER